MLRPSGDQRGEGGLLLSVTSRCLPVPMSFDEVGYDKYIAKLLLGLAYKRCEYKKAKEYGAQIGG